MVWAFLYWHARSVRTSFGTVNASKLVLFNLSFTRQYKQMSRSCALRFSGTRSVLLKTPSTFLTPPVFSFRLCLRPRVGSQPIHTTSTFELNSIANELIEDLSTNTAQLDDIASVAHVSHQEDQPLQSNVLGCNLKVTRLVDTVSCEQANCRVAGPCELMSRG